MSVQIFGSDRVVPLKSLLDSDDTVVYDIRDGMSYNRKHLVGARSLGLTATYNRVRKAKSLDFAFRISPDLAPGDKKTIVLYNQDGKVDEKLGLLLEIFAGEGRLVGHVVDGYRALEASGFTLEASDFGRSWKEIRVVGTDQEWESSRPRNFNYIEDRLAIGSEDIASDAALLKREGFTHILNVSSKGCAQIPEITCLWIGMSDNYLQSLFGLVPSCISYIDTALKEGGKLLVHCLAGISRSVSIVCIYYMWRDHITYDEALTRVRRKRSVAEPNMAFGFQIKTLEKTLVENNYDIITACAEATRRYVSEFMIDIC